MGDMNGLGGPILPSRSVERPARCIFCGAIGVWWTCGCEWGEKIRAGKVLKPRTVIRGGVAVIELCDELREAARAKNTAAAAGLWWMTPTRGG